MPGTRMLAVVALSIAIAVIVPILVHMLYPEQVVGAENVIEHVYNDTWPQISEAPGFVKGVVATGFRYHLFRGSGIVAVNKHNRLYFTYDNSSIETIILDKYIDASTGRVVDANILLQKLRSGSSVNISGYLVETPRGRVLVLVEVDVDESRYIATR